jgi:hypothetical protein
VTSQAVGGNEDAVWSHRASYRPCSAGDGAVVSGRLSTRSGNPAVLAAFNCGGVSARAGADASPASHPFPIKKSSSAIFGMTNLTTPFGKRRRGGNGLVPPGDVLAITATAPAGEMESSPIRQRVPDSRRAGPPRSMGCGTDLCDRGCRENVDRHESQHARPDSNPGGGFRGDRQNVRGAPCWAPPSSLSAERPRSPRRHQL